MFSGTRRWRRAVPASSSRRTIWAQRRAPDRTCTHRSTITLADAAKGTKTRVHLPTGKDVEVKIPAGIASGQQIRLKGQGWPSAAGRAGDAPDHDQCRAASVVQARWRRFAARAADHAFTKRCSAAKCASPHSDGAVGAGDPGRHQFRAHLPAQGQRASKRKAAPATCSPPCASCCRNSADDEFKELMKTVARQASPTIRAEDLE